MKSKPSIPKGTRDFLPKEVQSRQYIFDTLREVFELYDFVPIETPAIENLSTLTGKYGEEGDRLLFKILNNGDFWARASDEAKKSNDSTSILPQISKRGLRYDLTVPFARYTVMHRNDLSFPFKRYQMQPVWRADRPQKGRYQEFYQCDVDIIGSEALLYEAELVAIFDDAFSRLRVPVVIKINNRKILQGIAEVCGAGDQFIPFTVAIDKLDKIGESGVRELLLSLNLTVEQIDDVFKLINIVELDELFGYLDLSNIGKTGIEEIRQVQNFLSEHKFNNKIVFDWSLARGLSYYTGCIFEVECPNVKIGSIGGGGRYDDLTGIFGLDNISGVGVSFGLARIFDVMRELDLFPNDIQLQTKIILIAFDDESHKQAYKLLLQLRQEGIPSAIYPNPAKLKKQMKYANDRGFPFVGLIGKNEMENNLVTVKNMSTGEQESMNLNELIAKLR